MIQKRIAENISRVVDDWLGSLPGDLRERVKGRVKGRVIVTGGCITSMLLGERVNDYDFYFMDKDTVLEVARHYVNIFNAATEEDRKNRFGYSHKALLLDGAFDIEDQIISQGEEPWESAMLEGFTEDRVKIVIRSDGVGEVDLPDGLTDDDAFLSDADELPAEVLERATEPDGVKKKDRERFRLLYMSTNAITLTDKVQLVIRFHGDADSIHENFDFAHCTNYWANGVLHLNLEAMACTLGRELKFVGSKYPFCSLVRLRKFLKRGWTINAGQVLKIAMHLNRLDLTDPVVLEDQLVGVDTMYFIELIEKLRLDDHFNDSSMRDWNIDTSYVCSVIDKIFG